MSNKKKFKLKHFHRPAKGQAVMQEHDKCWAPAPRAILNKITELRNRESTRAERLSVYTKYLGSAWWRERREYAITLGGNKCNRCGCLDKLEVHHRTYERLGAERDDDLEVLCDSCHGSHHGRVKQTMWPTRPRD